MNDRIRIEQELICEADDCDALCQYLEAWIIDRVPSYRYSDLAGDFFASLREVIANQCLKNERQRDDAGQTALDTERDARREAREE